MNEQENIPYFNRLQEIKMGLRAKEAVAKPKKAIPKKSAKKIEQEKAERERLGGDDTDLVKWFKAKMKVADTCYWCGRKVENKIYQYAIYSICHILDKRDTVCPSVKTHPLNFIILCPDHHAMFDKMNWDEREQLPFWDIVRDRLIMVWPDLSPAEHRHFPQQVLDYMEKHKPF